MAGNRTFTIIKPTAFKKGFTGAIVDHIIHDGFTIIAMKLLRMSPDMAKAFYSVHEGKPFFEKLVYFMTSAPVIVAILEKENAVEEYRKLIGATDPSKAEAGTIRSLFGTDLTANAVHGSDSDENAEKESNFFFSAVERFH